MLFSASYVCLSLISLSVIKMHTSLSFFSRFGGCRSSLLRLQFVREADCRVEAILLLMLSMVHSGGSLSLVRTASTLDTISLVGIRFGVITIT